MKGTKGRRIEGFQGAGLGLVLALLLCSCAAEGPAPGQARATRGADLGPPPAPSRVVAASEGLVFSFRGPDGEWQQAERAEDVPAAARGEVVVVDLGRSPAERGSGDWVQVADLRAPGADGAYPVRVMLRSRWEQSQRPAPEASAAQPSAPPAAPGRATAAAPATGAGSTRLVMYSTQHCPVCRKARRFLEAMKIPFIEKDVERDPAAAAELARKAAQAGVSAGGVPVFEYRGKMLPGFDGDRLLALLRQG